MLKRATRLLWLGGALACVPTPAAHQPTPPQAAPERTRPSARAPVAGPVTPSENVRPPPIEPALQQRWSFDSGASQAAVVMADDTQVVLTAGPYAALGNPTSLILALDLRDGSRLWQHDSSDAGILVNARLLIPTWLSFERLDGDGELYIVRWKDGTLVRARRKSSATDPKKHASPPKCHAVETQLYCLGQPEITLPGEISRIASDDRHVCVAIADTRQLRCHQRADGRLLGASIVPLVDHVKHPEQAGFSLLLQSGVLVVARYDGRVDAYDLNISQATTDENGP